MKEFEELRLSLADSQWPAGRVDHDRLIARAIVADGEGRYFFAHIRRDDEFGRCELIETAGGGVEEGEALRDAIRRELREELGAEVEILGKLAFVSDYYNLIGRHNLNHYFLCRALSFGRRHLTEQEAQSFHMTTLSLSFDEAVATYERCACSPLGRLIAQRELPVLRYAHELLSAEYGEKP